MDTKHGVLDNMEKISRGYTTIGYKCKLCLYHSTSLISMDNHVMRHKSEQNFLNCENSNIEKYCCPECDFTTYLTLPYTQHVVDFHVNKLELDNTKFNIYICKECKFKTNFILKWFKHATNEGNHEKCNYTIEAKRYLQKRVRCDHCDYKTVKRSHLKQHHILNHLPEDEINWFECHQCSYRSKLKVCLVKHIQSKHSNDASNWFKCNHCDYKTVMKANLKQHHIAKHLPDDEISWFECHQCNYKLKTKGSLYRHMKTKHKNHNENNERRWFKCDDCHYKSAYNADLTNHRIVKHLPSDEIKWVKCDKCDYTTKTKNCLQKHVKRRHPKDE